jgi:1-acyl-sn-glycerol-3-phosphate acyltransferase
MHYRFMLHHRIAWVGIEGLDRIRSIPPNDGFLVCPNHSYTGDGSVVMQLARRIRRPTCIMAAWHVFRGHGGIDGWLLQRQGLFSVDREGTDRRAIRTAIELLETGKGLIVFPEGEIYHLNDRLTPLREGVAFMAVSAQKDIEKNGSMTHVWVVPCAIRYRFLGNISKRIEKRVEQIERRLLVRPRSGATIHQRIINLGEVLLTIKEKEHLGRSYEMEGDLPARIARLTEHLLARREQAHLGKTNPNELIPVRVKLLRRKLLESATDEQAGPALLPEVREALADVHLALQLFSYPGDYIATKPSCERMAETLEKFEEDMDGVEARPLGWRVARVIIGQPIIVRPVLKESPRALAGELTGRIELEIADMMKRT